jgi:serine protease Do
MIRSACTGFILSLFLWTQVQAAPLDVADLVEQEGPAVVNISTTRAAPAAGRQPFRMPQDEELGEFFRRFIPQLPEEGEDGRDLPARAEGSGFIVSPDGYILTNAHVVRGVDEVTVKLTDKRKYIAKVIGFDSRTDVAVIKIDAGNLPAVKIGNPQSLRVGEAVVAIGSPFGFENSVTAGIVSAKGRNLPAENYVPFIQTDVAINPGNSGGPLFNLQGQVVGINSQIYSRSGGYQGVAFAIPIDVAMEVADQLKKSGKVERGWLGVVIQEVSADLASSFGLPKPAGALIAEVQKDGPAAKAGIVASDVVLKFAGKPVESANDLPRLVGAIKPGASVPVEVWRKGASKTLKVVLGAFPEETRQAAATPAPKPERLRGGLALAELSPAQKSRLQIDSGLLVEAVEGDALRAGIQVGDIVLAVNNAEVKSREMYRKMIASVPAGRVAALLVRRGESVIYMPMRLTDKS